MKSILFCILLLAVTLTSCLKKYGASSTATETTAADAIAPEGFNFITTKNVSVNIKLLTNDNKPLTSVLVNVYSTSNNTAPIFTAATDAAGQINTTLVVPACIDSLVIDPVYVGLLQNATAVIRNNNVQAIIGGSNGYGGDIVASGRTASTGITPGMFAAKVAGTDGNTVYSYYGSYSDAGRPTALLTPDVISSGLLSYVNTSLPESVPISSSHPDYLLNNAETNLNISATSQVWITFLTEGAGYVNALGFYTFPTNHPPQSINDIDSIRIIIPNASLSGSGGTMQSGDKFSIGQFPAGVSIGFVLFQNAWQWSTHTVNTNSTKFFSDDALNYSEDATHKRHSVLLSDDTHQLFLCSFEDLVRQYGNADNDFNDLVFYATSNPVSGISSINVNPIDKPIDSDGDGVTDVYDKFPTDPARAYIRNYPGGGSWGTLAFEDNWPSTGDYDLNDLVVNYQYSYVVNAQNKVVELNGDYTVGAIGASYTNSFGIQFPFASNKVSAVSGQRLTGNYISLNSNGTEAGQNNAVVIPFDDPKNVLKASNFTNVFAGQNFVKSDTLHLHITFTSPLSEAELGNAPYNPFLISNQRRGYEVHLPGNKPTDKADTHLLGTGSDNSSVNANRYYLTKSKWPWALSFAAPFDHPLESKKISTAYLNFLSWAGAGGNNFTDWYTNKAGNRNTSLIFTH